MNFKKIFILLVFLFLIFYKNVSIPSKSIQLAMPYESITVSVITKSNQFKRGYFQNVILNDCNFIHRENFLDLDPRVFELMVSECDKYDIPYSIFFSVVDRESGFRFIENSEGSGAMGYMQMMPQTFNYCSAKLDLAGGNTPENNIKAGAYHLYDLHNDWSRKFSNDESWRWALAQYATGLGGMQVEDSTGVHYEIPESTKPGIERVMNNYLN